MKPMYILMLNTRRLLMVNHEAYLSQKLQNKIMRCNQFEERDLKFEADKPPNKISKMDRRKRNVQRSIPLSNQNSKKYP
jgi:hypothetical protein